MPVAKPYTKVKYDYKVRFFYLPYSGLFTYMCIETDNPDSEGFSVSCYDDDGNQVKQMLVNVYSDDNVPTDGGYATALYFPDAGTFTVKVKERQHKDWLC